MGCRSTRVGLTLAVAGPIAQLSEPWGWRGHPQEGSLRALQGVRMGGIVNRRSVGVQPVSAPHPVRALSGGGGGSSQGDKTVTMTQVICHGMGALKWQSVLTPGCSILRGRNDVNFSSSTPSSFSAFLPSRKKQLLFLQRGRCHHPHFPGEVSVLAQDTGVGGTRVGTCICFQTPAIQSSLLPSWELLSFR